jgi:uncharacterized cupin superfamily protein
MSIEESVIDRRVVNLDELELENFEKGDKFAASSARIGPLIGAKDLGYSYDVVPPGKRSCPSTATAREEEMFFIVRARARCATARNAQDPRRRRDLLSRRRPETAHQIVNDSKEELAYISVSTMMPAESASTRIRRRWAAYGGVTPAACAHDAHRRARRLLDGRGMSAIARVLPRFRAERIEREAAKYPPEQRQSAVMSALAIAPGRARLASGRR